MSQGHGAAAARETKTIAAGYADRLAAAVRRGIGPAKREQGTARTDGRAVPG